MKREIKFRGLRTDGKGWVYGYYYEHNGKSYIGSEAHSDDSDTYSNNEVISESVGQFTGLKDKNGVEIYEGDIIKTQTISDYVWNEDDVSKDTNYIIGFYNGSYCMFKDTESKYPVRQWKDGTNDWYSMENSETFLLEIIENIHDPKR